MPSLWAIKFNGTYLIESKEKDMARIRGNTEKEQFQREELYFCDLNSFDTDRILTIQVSYIHEANRRQRFCTLLIESRNCFIRMIYQ